MYWPGKVKNVLDSVLEVLPEFSMAEIMQKNTAWSSCALVCLQECGRMSLFLSEIRRSLKQLDLSLRASDSFINSTVAPLMRFGAFCCFFGNERIAILYDASVLFIVLQTKGELMFSPHMEVLQSTLF